MTVEFDARVAARGLDVAFRIAPGETVALVGPNGAGKSTLLALLAGLLRPDEGRATLDGTPLFDVGPGRRAFAAPHTRGVALLAQDALLFPHLTALDNVAFGPRSAGRSRAEARRTAERWLAEVEAADLGGRRPAALSGGQSQRVAVARALAAEPRLLLLDEPMAALDVAAAPALRRMLRRVLVDRTAVIVTHDALDALLLADRVLVVEGGRVVEEGPTREVFARPRTAFTAGLAGLILLTGTATERGFVTDDGARISTLGVGSHPVGTRLGAVVRPADVSIGETGATVLEQVVLDLEPRGDIVRVRGPIVSADVSPERAADLDLEPGDRAAFAFDPLGAYPL